MEDHSLKMLFICLLVMGTTQVHSAKVNITRLYDAAAKGAVCVDGSAPAYFHAAGHGDGANNWLVHLEGGGWCSHSYCNIWVKHFNNTNRADQKDFNRIFDEDKTKNPDFYNWNRVYVLYCDGGSFSGDVEEDEDYPEMKRRGARIFDAVMEDLLAKGMNKAKNAILTGTSAGGLATILHCDGFRALIPNASRLKCIADGGFFVRGKTDLLPADDKRASRFDSIVQFHNMTKFFPAECLSKRTASSCLFPENLINHIKTPIFLLQSAMDFYQIETGVTMDITYNSTWRDCAEKLQNCTDYQLKYMKDYRSVILKTIKDLGNPPQSRGMYVHSCVTHGHFDTFPGWDISPIPGKMGAKKAIGDWYFDRSPVQEIDSRNDVEPQMCELNPSY